MVRILRANASVLILSIVIVVITAFILRMIESSVLVARAATPETPAWQASVQDKQAHTISFPVGGELTFWVDFKNTGTETWSNTGEHFVAMNVTNPTGRTSASQHPYWRDWYRPARLEQASVPPGEVGRFRFALKAPDEPGTYREAFGLVAEHLQWIPGGMVELPVVVTGTPRFQASLLSEQPTLELDPGQEVTVEMDFKNTGSTTWTKDGGHFLAMNATNPTERSSVFRHRFWHTYYRPAKLWQDTVTPGETGRFRFALKAPDTPGTYVEDFNLVAEHLQWIPGGFVSLTITVGSAQAGAYGKQPNIRVGLYSTSAPTTVQSNGAYEVKSGNTVLFTRPAGSEITMQSTNGGYQATAGATTKDTNAPLRLVPTDSKTNVFTITSYENRPAWNTNFNDNSFRGTLELNRSASTGNTWVINELPLEWYLYGVAESGNSAPADYQKALVTAERSYALYHIRTGTKHKDEYFHVDATHDQVYRGYGFESRAGTVKLRVDATRGVVVTVNGSPVVTPYFSRTDGRTRSWEEVWGGGPKSWLTSVADPCCTQYSSLLGHGVGMSAQGALWFDQEKNWGWKKILNYYYSGSGIADLY